MRNKQYSRAITIYMSPEKFSIIKKITDEKEISIGSWFRNLADEVLAKDQQKQKLPAGAKKGLV